MSLKPLAVAGSVILVAGFIGGLVVAGRLSMTSPSGAAPAAVEATGAQATPVSLTTTTPTPLPLPAGLPDLSPVAEAALKAAANITSTTIVRRPADPFDPWSVFYGDQVQQAQSLGSGVVVSSDGYVLTNKHVIGSAGAEVRVTLADGRDRPAKLVGIDDVSDLAVVKVDAHNLQTLPWGDSSKLRVAEWVLAIGNPFQLSGTVTLGIISTVTRSGEQVGSSQDFIQTDAAINPGNSGGALVNARGELVGINTMIYSETGGYQGIGFAIPANLAHRIMDELVKNGTVAWGSIGNVTWFTIDQGVAERYGLNVTGAYVRSISRAASAYRAGLEPGDIVTSVNGQKVSDADQINRVVVRQPIGSTVSLGIVKRTGGTATIKVPVVSRESQTVRRQ
ncbi:MAG TPA: trypsin-like peptidase domain-containing protein [Vicinamibacterales bacterium]|jgi:S1-C subfamily serine protease|nr:trypsin-like peptidase domain-containing protein [Vicinamibacterales bacterium]